MRAKQLINRFTNLFTEEITEKLIAGEALSGIEVAGLKPKQHVFINGMRSVIFDAKKVGDSVEVVYMTGTKLYGPEKYLVVSYNAKATPIFSALEVNEGFKITRGMKRAYEKMNGVKKCPECGMVIPRYPGRYPSRCPHCSAELADFVEKKARKEGVKFRSASPKSTAKTLKQKEGYRKASRTKMRRGYTENWVRYYYYDNPQVRPS